MSRTIPGMRHSVAPSGAPNEQLPPGALIKEPSSATRIELVPSRRASALAGGWLALVCGVVTATVALPLPVRVGLCIAIATPALVAIRGCMLLVGRRAVRTLDWSAGWRARIGPGTTETSVTLQVGSFRVGRAFLLLWLRSCDGIHGVFIDAGRQDPAAFRRLCRQLHWPVSTS